jgi:tetratricopeptide (TPR) repeat protein
MAVMTLRGAAFLSRYAATCRTDVKVMDVQEGDDGLAIQSGVSNVFSGTARTVVQFRDIYGDIHLTQPPPLPAPHLLPADASIFVGRTEHLAALDALLVPGPAVAVIGAIVGTAGVGKTALAVHWGHQARQHFPDGQFYVDLGGYGVGPSVGPEQALDGFLRALDVPGREIPWGLEAMAGLFRSLVDNRRVLVIIDNAGRSDQVRPLLPGSPGSVALVTSRSQLSGLVARSGARRITLDLMSAAEATALLREATGAARVNAEPRATQDLARWCSYLPLTLRIVADRAVLRPRATLESLAEELAVEADRLELLSAGDDETTEIRVVLSWSYQKLPPQAARLFRLAGVNPGADVSLAAAAALASVSESRARRDLDTLVGAHLIGETIPGRFRFHDLLRVYAAERAARDDPPAELAAAVRRLLTWYLHTARAGYLVLAPNRYHFPLDQPGPDCRPLAFADRAEALSWFDQEASNVVAAATKAASAGEDGIAWRLPAALRGYFDASRPWQLWIAAHQIGLAAARRIKDPRGEDEALNSLGLAFADLGQYEEAIDHYQQALAVNRAAGDRKAESIVLHNLALAYRQLRRFDEAIDHFQQAAELDRDSGDQWGASVTLAAIGATLRSTGRLEEAIDCLERALEIQRGLNDLWSMSATLAHLGDVYRDLGQFDAALDYHRQSLAACRENRDRFEEATSLDKLGQTLSAAGLPGEARQAWREALEIFDELGAPQSAEIRRRLLEAPPGDSPE